MTHYKIKVVFRAIKHGDFKGDIEAVYADIRQDGFTMATDGGTYMNEWFVNHTRPAKPAEYAELLASMSDVTLGGDTYEFIPVARRIW